MHFSWRFISSNARLFFSKANLKTLLIWFRSWGWDDNKNWFDSKTKQRCKPVFPQNSLKFFPSNWKTCWFILRYVSSQCKLYKVKLKLYLFRTRTIESDSRSKRYILICSKKGDASAPTRRFPELRSDPGINWIPGNRDSVQVCPPRLTPFPIQKAAWDTERASDFRFRNSPIALSDRNYCCVTQGGCWLVDSLFQEAFLSRGVRLDFRFERISTNRSWLWRILDRKRCQSSCDDVVTFRKILESSGKVGSAASNVINCVHRFPLGIIPE